MSDMYPSQHHLSNYINISTYGHFVILPPNTRTLFHIECLVYDELVVLNSLTKKASFVMQDSEPDIIDGVGAETGHVIRTTTGGRNGQPKQVGGC